MARYRRFDVTGEFPAIAPTQEADAPEAPDAPEADEIDSDAIESVRLRRAGLKSAMSGLEIALAAPAPGRIDEWTAGVREALGVVQDVWTRHVVETEAPGAFLDELVEAAPRLATPAARLRDEHSEILTILIEVEDDLAPGDRRRGVGATAPRDVDEPAGRARTAPTARRRPRVRGLRRRHRRRLNLRPRAPAPPR